MKQSDTLVEVFIPRNAANKDPNFFVGVNGVSYLLPRGKKSRVPAAAAAEIERARRAEDAMYEAQDALRSKTE